MVIEEKVISATVIHTVTLLQNEFCFINSAVQ